MRKRVPSYSTGGVVEAEAPAPAAVSSEDPSEALKGQIDALRRSEENARQPKPAPQPLDVAATVNQTALPDLAKRWLIDHPDVVLDHKLNAKAQSLHYDILDQGHEAFGASYFTEMERQLLHKSHASDDVDPEAVERVLQEARDIPMHEDEAALISDSGNALHIRSTPKRHITSAPVSRSVPSSNGRRYSESIELTAQDKEFARISNVSLEDYARGKLEVQRRRERGELQ